jgi:hypothetical protein
MFLDSITLLEKFSESNRELRNPKNIISKMVEDYTNRNLAFDWLHGGRLSMTIKELSKVIGELESAPVRTGHLGNWQEIAAGRGCALDHNGTVCGKRKLGIPFITDFNQTENDAMNSGDVVYLPGSIINKMERNSLKIFTWDGSGFVERSRDSSYFVPFVLVPSEDELTALTTIQKRNFIAYKNTKFISSLVFENISLVKEIFLALFEYVRIEKNCFLKLSDLVDRSVSLDGQLFREELCYSNGCYKLGESSYASVNELISAIFLPMKAAHSPNDFFGDIKEMPKVMPFLSLALSCALDYVLNNFQEINENANFNTYFEWGAFGSAGYPPRSRGYYKQKARLIRIIYEILVKLMPEINPVLFILLPSSIFNLLPNSAYPNDAYYVNELISLVRQAGEELENSAPDILMNRIEKIVGLWFPQYKHQLSSYYLARFTKERCIHHQTLYHEYGEAMELPQFEQLTLQEACMMMGALHKIAKEEIIL